MRLLASYALADLEMRRVEDATCFTCLTNARFRVSSVQMAYSGQPTR